MMNLGDRIVAEARSYLGTPFHHHGRLKGVGLDCFGLIIGALRSLGTEVQDNKLYGRYPNELNGQQLIERLGQYLVEVPKDQMQDGDILVFWVFHKHLPQHLAVKTEVGMIHAFAKGRKKVTEHSLDRKWMKRLTHVFRPQEIK